MAGAIASILAVIIQIACSLFKVSEEKKRSYLKFVNQMGSSAKTSKSERDAYQSQRKAIMDARRKRLNK